MSVIDCAYLSGASLPIGEYDIGEPFHVSAYDIRRANLWMALHICQLPGMRYRGRRLEYKLRKAKRLRRY